MSIDIRIIATVIYLISIILTVKSASENGGSYMPDIMPLFTIPLFSFIYAIFWIIWLSFN
jgi:hypothetical protein